MRANNERITKYVDKDVVDEPSPMNPPDPYSPPAAPLVPREEMCAFLGELMDEHDAFAKALDAFESILGTIAEEGVNEAANRGLREFFEHFDTVFIAHHKREERELFPELERRLLEKGEHSHGEDTVTGVDVMVDEHLRAVQLAAVVFNLFGLSARLPDANSRLVAFDAAVEQGKALVELLRLHMFREDTIMLPLAQKLIAPDRLERMRRAGPSAG